MYGCVLYTLFMEWLCTFFVGCMRVPFFGGVVCFVDSLGGLSRLLLFDVIVRTVNMLACEPLLLLLL